MLPGWRRHPGLKVSGGLRLATDVAGVQQPVRASRPGGGRPGGRLVQAEGSQGSPSGVHCLSPPLATSMLSSRGAHAPRAQGSRWLTALIMTAVVTIRGVVERRATTRIARRRINRGASANIIDYDVIGTRALAAQGRKRAGRGRKEDKLLPRRRYG